MANIRVTKCQVNVNVIDTMYVMVDWHSRSQLSKRTVMVKWYGELSWRQSQHSDSHSDLSQCLYCLCAVRQYSDKGPMCQHHTMPHCYQLSLHFMSGVGGGLPRIVWNSAVWLDLVSAARLCLKTHGFKLGPKLTLQ